MQNMWFNYEDIMVFINSLPQEPLVTQLSMVIALLSIILTIIFYFRGKEKTIDNIIYYDYKNKI